MCRAENAQKSIVGDGVCAEGAHIPTAFDQSIEICGITHVSARGA